MAISEEWITRQFPDLIGIAPLGSGGQKAVFAGDHPVDGSVVLKLIHINQDTETVRREILAVTQVSSRRVPKILACGQCDTQLGSCFWLREQRISGYSLRTILQCGPISPTEILRLAHHILEALAHAEKVNIVHRDVKPDNIIRDNSGEFWLIDFGIARHLDLQSMTASGNAFGKATWGYAPIEQCRNLKSDIDARADLFALGVTLHEAASGVNVFRHNVSNPLEILKRVESLVLPSLDLPIKERAEFRNLVSSMVQKRRDHRIDTAAEAFKWCSEIVENEGVGDA